MKNMTLGGSSQSDFVDMDKMVSRMTREIDSFWSAYESGNRNKLFSINKVPQHILMEDKNAYEPIVLSIGPYHHGAPNLATMEKEKWRCLDYILKRNCKISLQDYIRALSKVEKQARSCYSEDMTMDKKRFIQMLLLDACFILVKVDGTVLAATTDRAVETAVESHQDLIRQISKHERTVNIPDPEIELTEVQGHTMETSKDRNLDNGERDKCANSSVGDWYANCTWHDLFLLENQMPFFIVETIYDLVGSDGAIKAKVRETIVDCVEDILRQFPKGVRSFDGTKSFHHLLHLCHMCLRPTQKTVVTHQQLQRATYYERLSHRVYKCFVGPKMDECEENLLSIQKKAVLQRDEQPSRWRQATQYHEAGIRFIKREYGSDDRHSLLDIKFNDGIIEMPCFPVDESTESLFKNLIAFEQIGPEYGNDITAYISFMSQIAATPDDAILLIQHGIIVHMLDSDDEVSALFVNLTKGIAFEFCGNYYLKSLCRILESHYQNRLNRWVAWLQQKHLSNPWLALTLLAAIVVLVCTIIQTIYTVLAYESPPVH